jgi:hypothetical protein
MTFRTQEERGSTYAARRCGTLGHEILANGTVVAWTVDAGWAAVIVGLLGMTEHEGPPAAGDAQRHLSP